MAILEPSGGSSVVELLPSKQAVASSNLVPRSSFTFRRSLGNAFWRQEVSSGSKPSHERVSRYDSEARCPASRGPQSNVLSRLRSLTVSSTIRKRFPPRTAPMMPAMKAGMPLMAAIANAAPASVPPKDTASPTPR